MATLHIFNPEHDIALASNLSNFTSPHAGRQLRHDLGFLPAIWAKEGDYVLVDQVEDALTAYSRLMHKSFEGFVDKRSLARLDVTGIEPWGWDLALRFALLRYGISKEVLLSEEEITVIRELSHRKSAVRLLEDLQLPGTVGFSTLQDSLAGVGQMLASYHRIVLKAPWSSSGRGIRFVDEAMNEHQQRWVSNVIARQGCVVAEPYYNKVKDFGMEFESDGRGCVRYLGLSLFHTANGAYTGNILASEDEKQEALNRYLSTALLDSVKKKIEAVLGTLFNGRYRGPFGVDMMIVANGEGRGFLLHPCVEINLRRTMGHVALELAKHCQSQQVMMIDYLDNTYKLKIRQI